MIMQVLKLEIKIRDDLLLSKLILLTSKKKSRVSTITAAIRHMIIAIDNNPQRSRCAYETLFLSCTLIETVFQCLLAHCIFFTGVLFHTTYNDLSQIDA